MRCIFIELCWTQQRLSGPDSQQKHPEKDAKADHTHAGNRTARQLKLDLFYLFSWCRTHFSTASDYISTGAVRPTISSPF